MTQPKDQIYIAKVLDGDTSAFSYLVERHKDMAYTVALKVVRDSQDAEEVTQDSFVKAFQQLRTFQGKSKFSTWLYTIVYRTAISKTRKKKIAVTGLDDYVVNNYATDVSDAHLQGMQQEERQKYIKAAIENLPEIDALLVTLFYVNDNTLDEIEKITGYTKTNIKVRLFRARKKLYKSLESFLNEELKTIL